MSKLAWYKSTMVCVLLFPVLNCQAKSLWKLAQENQEVLRITTLFTAQNVRDHLSSEEGMNDAIDWCKETGVTHVFIETFRSNYTVEKGLLERSRDRFRKAGFTVSGCVTTTKVGKQSTGWNLIDCYTDIPTQETLQKIFVYTASLFDEIMIDDFLFTDCQCDACKHARSEQSWADYRCELMVDVSRQRILAPARAVNPGVKLIIKYPQWYDNFHNRGYEVVRQTADYDRIWVGTETRDYEDERWGGKVQYEAYYIMRWLGEIGGSKTGGGWFDPYGTHEDTYVEQARQTVLAGAKEMLLFCYGSLQRDTGPANVEKLRTEIPGLFQLAKLIRNKPPKGIAAPKPPNSDAFQEQYVYDFVGMLGLPLVPTARLDTEALAAFLPVHAMKNSHLAEKLNTMLKAGKPLLITDGLAKKLPPSTAENKGMTILKVNGKPKSLLELTRQELKPIRDKLLGPLGLKFDAPNKVALYLMGDDCIVVENFNDQPITATLEFTQSIHAKKALVLPVDGEARLSYASGQIQFHKITPRTLVALTVSAEDTQMQTWWTDPLTQLLKDHQKEETKIPGMIHAARGETEAIQLAIRSKTPVHVKVRAQPFSDHIPVRVRAVGRVPITRGTHYTPPEERVALPPVDLPDPLYETSEMALGAEETQSFWIDVFVPEGTAPKEYQTWITVEAGETKHTLPLRLQVYPVTIPFEGDLLLTNWFSVKTEDMGFKDAKIGDKDWWSCADLLFDSMWAHRQNMFWTPLRAPWIQPEIGEDGRLLFDFTFFDRWVEAFSRPRGGKRKTYIEGQPIAARQGGYSGKIKASVWRIKDQTLQKRVIEADDPEAEQGYADFLIALQQHLKDKGWLNRFRLHICDEPHGAQLKPYGLIAGYVRKYAPDLCVMEALDVKDDFDFFEQNCDVWVPQLGRFNKTLPNMLERLDRGKEVWFYTCLWPNGKYPNRFVDYPLIKTRILQWINFKWGFTGYLHWGFNHWRGGDPFTVLEPHHGGQTYLPAGDAWIVYPGKKAVWDSMRHEAMRDSVEDYELLRLLEKKDPEQAKRLADSLIRSFEDYERNGSVFRAARIKLLNSFF